LDPVALANLVGIQRGPALDGYAKLSRNETRWAMTDRNGEPLNVGDEVLLRGSKEDDAALVTILEERADNMYLVRLVEQASAWTPANLPLHDAIIDANLPAVEAWRETSGEPFVVAGAALEVFEYDHDDE